MTYKGYKIVGMYPQYDVWALDANGEATELVEEWDRNSDPMFIQVWSWDTDGYWSWLGDFEDEEFESVKEAKAAIDKFVKEKA